MKYIQAKAKLYEIVSSKTATEVVSLTISFIEGEETELSPLKKSVSKSQLLNWLIKGFSIEGVESPIVITFKGVSGIINEFSRYIYSPTAKKEKVEQYKQIKNILPTKSHIEKNYKLYEFFLQELIVYDKITQTIFDEVADEMSLKSRRIEFYKILLKSFV